MPRGFGNGRGYWRAYGGGMGRGYRYRSPDIRPGEGVSGFEYVGPCRCGWGPNAYYRADDGRIVHASSISPVTPEPVVGGARSEIENLRTENERLEARVRELEERLGSR
ncbi:MAG TPA: hypothetical protein VF374_01590 [Thermoplasmata archaeon]|jgi:hypothetical protein